MRLAWLKSLAIVTTVAAIGGCGSGASGSSAPKDATVYDLAIDLPPGCPPSSANSTGVGIPCTRGGGECRKAGVPSGLLCTCDPLPIIGVLLDGVPCICTIAGPNESASSTDPCSAQANGRASGFCGSGATCCPYLTEAYYCSPDVCLPGGSCIDFTTSTSSGD